MCHVIFLKVIYILYIVLQYPLQFPILILNGVYLYTLYIVFKMFKM